MKVLGLIIAALGLLIVAGAATLTPAHSFNVADSNNGISANAAIFFGGLIVFGAGVVTYASSLGKNPNKAS